MQAVGGSALRTSLAILPGYARTGVQDSIVPMITAQPAAKVFGTLLHDVPADAMDRFDLYEFAWDYSRITTIVHVGDVPHSAALYLPPADQRPTDADWSLAVWEADHADAAILAAQELFARDPMPTAPELLALYPMALKRAWARLRAQSRKAPATLRAAHSRRHTPDVAEIHAPNPPQGRFYALQSFTAAHQRFDGTPSGPLPREVFYGIDAALVLPYDPVTDRVLLVEQLRIGPLALDDPNPWTLEPIAGMVDAAETPEQAARREAAEEAGLTDLMLEHIASFYPSPGSSTDYFTCYLGLTALQDATYTGGLVDEHEDLRLHPITFDHAMQLAQSGEITAGPLLTMLYWLALNRDRLRA